MRHGEKFYLVHDGCVITDVGSESFHSEIAAVQHCGVSLSEDVSWDSIDRTSEKRDDFIRSFHKPLHIQVVFRIHIQFADGERVQVHAV